MTDKQIIKLHNRIKYWREFPLLSTDSNPYFHKGIDIVRTPEFASFYKNAIKNLIIKDWNVKRIDDFNEKFEYVWNTDDYLIMAENWYRFLAKAPKMKWNDLFQTQNY